MYLTLGQISISNHRVDVVFYFLSHFILFQKKAQALYYKHGIHQIPFTQATRFQLYERRAGRGKEMVGPERPQFVLFGSSIVQFSFSNEGWGAVLAHIYARKVFFFPLSFFLSYFLMGI